MTEQQWTGNGVTNVHPFDLNKAVDVSVLNEFITVNDDYLATTVNDAAAPIDPLVTWEPKRIKPYSEAKKIHITIEYQGAKNFTIERVILIGLLLDGPFTEIDNVIIFEASEINDNAAETEILTQFLNTIERLDPDFISIHGASFFHIPALIGRLDALDIVHGFHISNEQQKLSSGTLFGTPVSYKPVKLVLPGNPVRPVHIIDTLLLAHQEREISESYSLESLAIQFQFRKEKRKTKYRTVPEIKDAWLSQSPEAISELRQGLIYYLENQKLVTDKFLKIIWPQQQWVPLPLQELAIASVPEKWDAILKGCYEPFEYTLLPNGDRYFPPETDPKRSYEGAKVRYNLGAYRNFVRLAIENLYPTIVTRYGLSDLEKDPLRMGETILTALKGESIQKQTNDSAAANQLINGYQAFLGTMASHYNSITMAALTAAYARIIMDQLHENIKTWGNIITVSTDTITFQPTNCAPWTTDGGNEVNDAMLIQSVKSFIPEGFEATIELNCPEGGIISPNATSSIYWPTPDSAPVIKGIYRKRNSCKLLRDFPIEYSRRLVFGDSKSADVYYQEVLDRLRQATLNEIDNETLELITFTQRIPSFGKLLVESGVGKPGDIVSFYWSAYKVTPPQRTHKFPVRVKIDLDGNHKIDKQPGLSDNSNAKINVDQYKLMIDKLKVEIDTAVLSIPK